LTATLALTRAYLKLALRERGVLFFNYVFPLIFFFGFGQFMGAQPGGAMSRVISMVLVIGVLGNGLFGAGLRAVMEREANILRRFRVTPIGPLAMLVAMIVSGWILYLPAVALVVGLARAIYGMPLPERWFTLLVVVTVGSWAFRAIGLIVAAVANSMAESNILIQILYMPMMFISGATFPLSVLPLTAQIVAQFLPASYLNSAIQRVMLRSEGLDAVAGSLAAMLLSTVVATFIAMKLFRWEKEEKLARASKLWVLAAFLPFIVLGVREAYSRQEIRQAKALDREIRRNLPRLIRGAHIFTGDGGVIASGGVLIRSGRIAEVYEGTPPEAKTLRADAIEAAGKTILPGLIDVHAHLGAPGGLFENPEDYQKWGGIRRALAAQLYAGVTAVKSAGDFTDEALAVRREIGSGERLGAEFFLVGPLFTAPKGHPTRMFAEAPAMFREMAGRQFTRTPATADEAKSQVEELKRLGVDGIKAVMEAGAGRMLFERLDPALLRAIGEAARSARLPLVVHTGDARDIAGALDAGAAGIEHGSFRERIPPALFERMAKDGVFYDPTLTVVEAFAEMGQGRRDLLARSLVEQVAPPGLLESTRKMLDRAAERYRGYPVALEIAMENLREAWKAGVPLATGSDAGNPMAVHGAALHRELQLWVKAGLPPAAVLQAATHGAARLLGASDRIGLIRKGYEATLIVVDGDPLRDISTTERISTVFLKGERVDRAGLFEQDK
jgi:imidazolonepropionase-like amidohydrolase/ABC-type multidrug transport system permease subunit